MNVEVPLRLLEDILRLFEYLDKRNKHEERYFRNLGYAHLLRHDFAIWELRLEIKRLQEQMMETYLLTLGHVADYERLDLLKWIEDGNCVCSNPWYYCDEKGEAMDYITATRFLEAQLAETSPLHDCTPVGNQGWEEEQELPF